MKYLVILVSLISSSVYAKENCSLENIGLEERSHKAEKLFYVGTCHFRNKDFEKAVQNWQALSGLKNVPSEYEELMIDVLNNLGYMLYSGYGIEKSETQAIEKWQQAILAGHYESEYHLCHAYADKVRPTYNYAKAKKHCEKANLIYKGMDKKTQKS